MCVYDGKLDFPAATFPNEWKIDVWGDGYMVNNPLRERYA
jgi:hypothetical protein